MRLLMLSLLITFQSQAQTFHGQKHLRERGNPAVHNHAEHSTSHKAHQLAWLPWDCAENEYWNALTLMCQRRPAKEDFRHIMVHGNAFAVGTSMSGPRGGQKFAVPNMLMVNWGGGLSENHAINADLMLTAERWTFPRTGYPELFQIGELRSDGRPYIDYQHPHSSPIMGLTLSDTIRMGERDLFKISFAPRGQAAEGPVPFMHRPTGVMNPDAPLGHHIGQDVAHITSTVLALSYYRGDNIFEVSGFHGGDPDPNKSDLPLGKINSFAARWIKSLTPNLLAMVSWSYLDLRGHHEDDEVDEASTEHGLSSAQRASTSLYSRHRLGSWLLLNTFIFGELDTRGELTTTQLSFLDEVTLQKDKHSIWGRVEFLERLPQQLGINLTAEKWVTALTLGYSHRILSLNHLDVRTGVSGTIDFVPSEWRAAYGSRPATGRVFVQVSGMKMW